MGGKMVMVNFEKQLRFYITLGVLYTFCKYVHSIPPPLHKAYLLHVQAKDSNKFLVKTMHMMYNAATCIVTGKVPNLLKNFRIYFGKFESVDLIKTVIFNMEHITRPHALYPSQQHRWHVICCVSVPYSPNTYWLQKNLREFFTPKMFCFTAEYAATNNYCTTTKFEQQK